MDCSLINPDNPQNWIEFVKRMFGQINTAIPGEIVAFDPEYQTATVRPCIRSIVIMENKEKKNVDLPQIANCPVILPYSTTTGFAITYPIKPHDQCLIIFSQRSFDKWMKYGSIQDSTDPHFPKSHDYNDAICLVGLIPNANKIENYNNDAIELRTKTGETSITVGNGVDVVDGIEIKSATNVNIETDGFEAHFNIGGFNFTSFSLDGNLTVSLALHLPGKVYVGGGDEEGLTQTVNIEGTKLKFVNGILVEVS